MWLEVLVVAFLAQLMVLPGEKGQFIVAGLSTRYDPRVVVAAAASAFAGWTALEIAFGEALQRALPPLVLDGLTAALFLAFAVLLVRSAPAPGRSLAETDGGAAAAGSDGGTSAPESAAEGRVPAVDPDVRVFGHEVPDRLGGFLPIFVLMAAGEFGDKTQLVTIGLAAKYGATSAIWAGEMLAIVPVTVANAYLFHRFADRLDVRLVHLAAAALFAFFGLDTLVAMATGFSVWETVVSAVAAAVFAVV